MARRYDSQTTTFSPEGRLYQVEYAIAAIQNAAAAVAVQTPEGIVIAGERKVTSKLLAPPKSSEKMYKIDDHCAAIVAGLNSDADILIAFARLTAQRHKFTYGEPQPMEQLVQIVADMKHGYTQRGGLRPFGCGFLFAGWDVHRGFRVYQTDPSGNYSGWKATAIGNNSATAVSTLKKEYEEGMTLEQAKELAVKVLCKALDTTHPSAERMEVATLTIAPSALAASTAATAASSTAAAGGAGGAAAGSGSAAASVVPAATAAASLTADTPIVQSMLPAAEVQAIIDRVVPKEGEGAAAAASGGAKASM